MATLRPGDRLGRFRLERKLGVDGETQIWLAVDKASGALDRLLLLHLFPTGDAARPPSSTTSGSLGGLDPRMVAARQKAGVQHPHLAEIQLMGLEEGFAWVATAWAEGQPLDAWLTRLDAHGLVLPRSAVVEVGMQLARGLAALHEARSASGEPRSLFHGRLCSREIWLTRDGRVQLMPFPMGQRAAVLSIARGMAPEVSRRAGESTVAGELFSVGAFLFELGTGGPLHDGHDREEIRRQAAAPLSEESLGRLRGAMPEIAPLVETLLARDPSDRPASARVVAGQLAEALGAFQRPTDLAGLASWIGLLDAPAGRVRQGLSVWWPVSDDPDWCAVRDAARRTLGGETEEAAPVPEISTEVAVSTEVQAGPKTGLWARLKMSVSDFFTSPKTRRARSQAAFFMSVAKGMEAEAMQGTNAEAWHTYYDELGRALLADETCFEAYWVRAHAPLHFFRSLRPDRRSPRTREVARRWDADLRWLLTNFPEKPPSGRSLAAARELRGDFERLCRGLERG